MFEELSTVTKSINEQEEELRTQKLTTLRTWSMKTKATWGWELTRSSTVSSRATEYISELFDACTGILDQHDVTVPYGGYPIDGADGVTGYVNSIQRIHRHCNEALHELQRLTISQHSRLKLVCLLPPYAISSSLAPINLDQIMLPNWFTFITNASLLPPLNELSSKSEPIRPARRISPLLSTATASGLGSCYKDLELEWGKWNTIIPANPSS